jgi:membrane protease subunit HflC
MKKALALFGLLLLLVIVLSSAYTIDETEQAIITQFGKPVGDPIKQAGIHFKIPVIQIANRMEKRVLPWDGDPVRMPTLEKTYIIVDTYARWQIEDPLEFFRILRDERSTKSRLDDILGSETRNAVAKHNLIEIIRTTVDRKQPDSDDFGGDSSQWDTITKGRQVIETEILAAAKPKLAEFGIALLDLRFKRIDYNQTVKKEIFGRMISERDRIAQRFTYEGNGEAAKIQGNKERDVKRIESEAYKKVLTLKGNADAKAIEIYAEAYNKSPEAVAFYEFLKTMETFKTVIDENTTMVLSTEGDLFKYLKGVNPDKAE